MCYFHLNGGWDPFTGVNVGEAMKPGPVNIVSRNIHGIYANLMACIRTQADVICIQAADIGESDVIDFAMQAADAGYSCSDSEDVRRQKRQKSSYAA